MRLLPAGSSPASPVKAETPDVATADVSKKRGRPRKSAEDASEKAQEAPQAASAVVAAPTDYTRPGTSTELLMDLQRRVIALEEKQTRKLTAAEFAIAVQATTGISIEALAKNGYVVEKCQCESRDCKGWRITPVAHYRTTDDIKHKDTSPVRVEELKDVEPAPTKVMEVTDESPLGFIFNKMFEDKLLKRNKKGQTLIPDDGPITWTHRQQLAFAEGFDMTDLLALEGKPRELQRQLIKTLHEIGYTNIVSAKVKDA